MTRLSGLAIHLDWADEHKPAYPRLDRLAGQVERAIHIYLTVRVQGVGPIVLHDMHTGSAMHHPICDLQGRAPVYSGLQIANHDRTNSLG